MIYLLLFWSFFKVGLFSFGGAYGAIPLIQDAVLSHGWLTEEIFTYFVAVSESTPGPIMVNLASYIGSKQAGFLGAAIATFGVVLPSFLIILIIVSLLDNFIKNKYIQALLTGIKPSFIGIVMALGIYLVIINICALSNSFSIDWKSLLITAILFALTFGFKKMRRRDFSPIILIIIAAALGIVLYSA